MSAPEAAAELPDLSGLRTDPPPDDGSQFVALAVDEHARRDGDPEPRWCVVQWAPSYTGGAPFWRWSVPGYTTSVRVLGWLPLPRNDWFGEAWRARLGGAGCDAGRG